MAAAREMKLEQLNLQKRQQLVEEFKLGLIDLDEFRTEKAKLEKKVNSSDQCLGSPPWDTEREGVTLSDVEVDD
jgi:hypothetical protein